MRNLHTNTHLYIYIYIYTTTTTPRTHAVTYFTKGFIMLSQSHARRTVPQISEIFTMCKMEDLGGSGKYFRRSWMILSRVLSNKVLFIFPKTKSVSFILIYIQFYYTFWLSNSAIIR